MEEYFLKWINIVDFKCFHNFEAKDFQRVNLISGKNNVGKTAFMEACYINRRAMDIKNFVGVLFGIKYMRENMNILIDKMRVDVKTFIEPSHGLNLMSNINNVSFEIQEKEGIKLYDFTFNKQRINVNTNAFSYMLDNMTNIQFIDSFGLSNGNIVSNYSAIQKKEKEDFLNIVLHEFDNSIEWFKVLELPTCKINGQLLEITELGDGVRHIISIVTALFQCEKGYLFIDEIENGIHYSHLDKVWEVILKVSKDVDCQVFATTHSKECIESYARVAKKIEDKEIAFIELGKNKNNEIKAITMDYDRLQNEIENANEVRGW
jgi:predicted ATP-dependent endonuclease of OLD family